ncbi:hypothetical protein [uncultured Shewanella sp.]|uniref:hypothetical protein n=1 Tax=uncultured Shewanella sp. TaxID=173975 RepID=UPI00261AC9C1|nr:hypothetical protein [uncultured Shewanella sp.]
MDDAILIVKIITAICTFVGLAKITFDINSGIKTRLREEYLFAKNFLKDMEKETLHPFAIQKGYQAIAGDQFLNLEAIKYVLSLTDPLESLKNFKLAKNIVHYDEACAIFTFKKFYKSTSVRWGMKIFFFFIYVLLSSAITFLLMYDEQLKLTIQGLIFFIPILAYMAITSLLACLKIKQAEALVNRQKIHDTHKRIKPINTTRQIS